LRRAGESTASAAVNVRPPATPARPRSKTAPSASAAKTPEKGARRSIARWSLGIALGAVIVAAVGIVVFGRKAPPPVVLLETRVRTEPPGLPVQLDGAPLAGEVVQFSAGEPFAELSASQACRETKHRLESADAGREVVLVLDPARADVPVDPGVSGARVTLNGQEAGPVPATIELDLCRENTISVAADGFRTAITTIPAKATPLDARTAAAAIKLESIPTGRILLPATRMPLAFFIDGKPAERTSAGIELPAGSHEVRATNEDRFVEVRTMVDVPAGADATPQLALPAIAQLVVQTFPPNCQVSLKRAGSGWRAVGEAPLRHELAAGRYTLRIESPVSGESRERDIDLVPGKSAPVRVSFGRSGR
jgi:hypothetical protein